VASKQVFRKKWCKKGVFFINDLMERDGGFMTLEGFNNKYHVNVNLIDFHGLIKAVPRCTIFFEKPVYLPPLSVYYTKGVG
jgi:hypothetical protein